MNPIKKFHKEQKFEEKKFYLKKKLPDLIMISNNPSGV